MTITELYEAYRDRLFVFANSFIKDPEAAQDIVQNVFYNLLKKPYDDNEKVLFTSVRNGCCNYIKRKRYFEIVDDIQEESFQRNFESMEIRAYLMVALYKYIQDLPKQLRKIMLLSIEGNNPEEISIIMKIGYKTVRNQKSTAVTRLREMFKNSDLFNELL